MKFNRVVVHAPEFNRQDQEWGDGVDMPPDVIIDDKIVMTRIGLIGEDNWAYRVASYMIAKEDA